MLASSIAIGIYSGVDTDHIKPVAPYQTASFISCLTTLVSQLSRQLIIFPSHGPTRKWKIAFRKDDHL